MLIGLVDFFWENDNEVSFPPQKILGFEMMHFSCDRPIHHRKSDVIMKKLFAYNKYVNKVVYTLE